MVHETLSCPTAAKPGFLQSKGFTFAQDNEKKSALGGECE